MMVQEIQEKDGEGWFKGTPTKPDVDLILSKYPNIAPGDEILYQDIAEIIGHPVGTRRFLTVTKAWRHRLRYEFNLNVSCNAGVSFYVETPTERISTAFRKLQTAGRRTKDALDLLVKTDRDKLSQQDRARLDTQVFAAGSIVGVLNTLPKQLVPPKKKS